MTMKHCFDSGLFHFLCIGGKIVSLSFPTNALKGPRRVSPDNVCQTPNTLLTKK